jgi:phosphonate transport system substrate-binding protein
MKRTMSLLTILICFLLLSTHVFAGETYKFSMLPRYSPEEINKRITPLVQYLSTVLNIPVESTMMINFDQYTKRVSSGQIEIGYENPYIYTLVSETHEALAMAVKGRDGDKLRGVIIAKKGSDIRDVEDLKGKRVMIVSRKAAGGYLSQKLTMIEKGIDLDKDCEVLEAVDNKQENVIISVFIGEADAGFIRESALDRVNTFVPLSQIEVINRSAWLPNWALSVNRSLPQDRKDAIQQALVSLKKGDPVLMALKIDSFRSATDQEYDSVRKAAGSLR